jgi:hypothetical protein
VHAENIIERGLHQHRDQPALVRLVDDDARVPLEQKVVLDLLSQY